MIPKASEQHLPEDERRGAHQVDQDTTETMCIDDDELDYQWMVITRWTLYIMGAPVWLLVSVTIIVQAYRFAELPAAISAGIMCLMVLVAVVRAELACHRCDELSDRSQWEA